MGRDGISNNDPLADKKYKGPGIFEQLGEDLLGLRRPLDCIQIEVTSNCTAHCIYCPHTTLGKNWKSRDMPPEVFAALWPDLRRSARAHLQGWGEPFLHPRFFDFVKFAQKAGCAVSTTSCGLYMDEENASKTANSGMDLIAFSLVGTDRASNNARAGADFEKVCASIKNLERALKQTGKPMEIHLAYLLLADRIEAIKKLPELMDSLDVDMAVISTLDYLALPEQVELAFYPDEQEKIARTREVLEEVASRAEALGRMIHFSLPSPMQQKYKGGCRENMAKTLYVDADGDISPCVYLNVPGSKMEEKIRVFGNALKEDPLTIWKKEEFAAFRKKLLDGQPDIACLGCPKRHEA